MTKQSQNYSAQKKHEVSTYFWPYSVFPPSRQLLTWMWGVAKGLISQPLSTQRKLEAVITVMETPAASTVSCAKVMCSVLYRKKQTNQVSTACKYDKCNFLWI